MSLSRFQRMVGIAEDEYMHLKSLQQITNPLQSRFLSFAKEYDQQGMIHDPYVRVQRQGETLNQMINIKDDLRKRAIQVTPRPYQGRVQNLFDFVADKIGVNAKGEMYDSHGAIIEGSNITDLVQHAVRDRRRNIVPTGWNEFLNVLRNNNAPRMILNYDTLGEMQAAQLPKSSPTSSTKRPTRVDNKRRKDLAAAAAAAVKSKYIFKSKSPASRKKPTTSIRIKREPKEPDYFNPGIGGKGGKKYV